MIQFIRFQKGGTLAFNTMMLHLNITIYGLGRQSITAAGIVVPNCTLIASSRAFIYVYTVQADNNKLLCIYCTYQVFRNAYLQETYNNIQSIK